MTEVLSTALAFIAILGILIFFHELGHFSAAKALGMKVEELAFGFGPRLVRLFKRKETEYTIRAVPLGGFVRLPGMEPGDESTPDGFNSQPVWRRALVVFAGPFASFLLGYMVFSLLGFTVGFPPENARPEPVVGIVQPGMPADKVGLKSGDRILEISGRKITSGNQVLQIVHGSPNKPLRLVVKRDDRIFTITATPEPQTEFGIVRPGSAADKAGLKSGDRILEIAGKKITSGRQVLKYAYGGSSRPLSVKVARGENKVIVLKAPPESLRQVMGLLGFAPHRPTVRTSIGQSIVYGTQITIGSIRELISALTSKDRIKSVGGVVAIARVTEKTAESGPAALLGEIGMLSLSLAIINLIPWPVLDGGHLLFLLIEWVRGGRKLTVEQQAAITSLGLATLVFLAVLLFYVDITRWITGTPLQ